MTVHTERMTTRASSADLELVLDTTRKQAAIGRQLTEKEISAVLHLQRERAGSLLAAAAIYQLTPENDIADFSGYLAHIKATRALSNMAGERGITSGQRAAVRRSQRHTELHYRAAAGKFVPTLNAVDSYTATFDERYMGEGKLNREALAQLYDRTDEISHPALTLLPPANTFRENNPRRDIIVTADRLLRHIVDQALPNYSAVQ